MSPPDKVLGKLKYGPPLMNVQADRSQPGSLAACGWDDEGVKPETYRLITNGIVVVYQTTREQAPYLTAWYAAQGRPVRSHGNSYAQSWDDVQFQRMPNVSLLPGDTEQSYEDLIAATDRGIAITGRGSFSIDQQRYNAQFGGQLFHEIRGGKVVGMLKDVAYQMRTPEFWGAMDMIGASRATCSSAPTTTARGAARECERGRQPRRGDRGAAGAGAGLHLHEPERRGVAGGLTRRGRAGRPAPSR